MYPRLTLALVLLTVCVFVTASPAWAAPRPPSQTNVEPTAPPPPTLADAPGTDATPAPSEPVAIASAAVRAPANDTSGVRYYVVERGDTLSDIAAKFGVTASAIMHANNIVDADRIYVGQKLVIPGKAGSTGGSGTGSGGSGSSAAAPAPAPKKHPSITERLTYRAKIAGADSPFYGTTWVTYYGRPNVPQMGILGEYDIPDLLWKLKQQSRAYDAANGPNLDVMPAFHLVYGMAVKWSDDGSYLNYMSDKAVMEYIIAARDAGISVILDVQIGGLTAAEALAPALPFLKYDNVHLAIDPEFKLSYPGQKIPGVPEGTITAAEVNQAQLAMSNYMQQIGVDGRRILILHQFTPAMIQGKSKLYRYDGIDLTICADGWGGPWPKISKYNQFMDETVQFTGFKLFYRWDEPIMDEEQALGVTPYPKIGYMEVTPNLIIYQ